MLLCGLQLQPLPALPLLSPLLWAPLREPLLPLPWDPLWEPHKPAPPSLLALLSLSLLQVCQFICPRQAQALV